MELLRQSIRRRSLLSRLGLAALFGTGVAKAVPQPQKIVYLEMTDRLIALEKAWRHIEDRRCDCWYIGRDSKTDDAIVYVAFGDSPWYGDYRLHGSHCYFGDKEIF